MSDQTKFILLVEDNSDDEVLTLRALRKGNILNEIVCVRDGAEALDFLYGKGAYAGRDISNLPQVVLLDLKLPKVDGLDVLKKIRSEELTKRMPVAVLTSSREEQDILKAYDRGANSYIVKPVDLTQFNDAVKNLGLYWMVLNENANR